MRNFYILFKKYWGGVLILLLLNTPSVFAQSGFSLSWDSEVGCLNYSEDRKDEVLLEDISDDDCLLVCEGSEVNFKLIYDQGEHEVESIDWEPENGNLVETSNNDTSAKISWPNPTDNGGVTVHIVLENGEEIYATICVKVKPNPDAQFIVDNNVNQSFCSHIDIDFQNISQAADGFQIVANHWDFGDGSSSNAENPVHSYDQPGVYIVNLTVYDECGCSNVYKEEVHVTEPGLEISCPTVTCEGSIETYSVVGTPYTDERVECNDYKWIVEGGHIVQQQGDWVDVIWDNVDEDGFGYLYFDQSSCNVKCQNILVAKIPVVTKKGKIKGGKESLCEGEQSTYKLPQWPTTDFQWTVYDAAGATYPDAIVLTDQRNQIVVDAEGLPPGEYILRSDYNNTLRQCGGEAEFKFEVQGKLKIENHTQKVCEGDGVEFSLTEPASGAHWEATLYGQTIDQGNGNHFNPIFDNPGNYRITVTAPDHCQAVTSVEVYEIPEIADTDIQGPDEVCPGESEIYTFEGDTQGFDIKWQVSHGEILGPDNSDEVTVAFTPGYAEYEVSVQLVNLGFNDCMSNIATKVVDKMSPDVEIVNTANNSSEGPQTFCSSNSAQFTLDYPSDTYVWSVTPNKLGQVSEDTQGTDTPTILFNEPYTDENDNFITDGIIFVEARVCGKMEVIDSLDFSLIQAPSLSITNAPNEVCAGEAFDIEVSSSFDIEVDDPDNDMKITFYNIDNEVTQTVIGGVQNNPTSFTFEDIELNNSENYQSLTYKIEIENNTCHKGTVTGSITVVPAPDVEISIDQNGNVFCQQNLISTVFVATVQGSNNSYQWLFNGTDIPGETTNTLNLGNWPDADFGLYSVKVTNTNGCTTISNSISVRQNCGSSGPPGCEQPQTVNLNASWDACESIKLDGADYTTNGGQSPLNFTWYLESDFTEENATLDNNSQDPIRYYHAAAAGKYYFAYKVNYGQGCSFFAQDSVVVGYHADIKSEITCNGNNYEVTLLNKSGYYDDFEGNTTVDYTITDLNTGIPQGLISQDDMEAIANLDEGDYELKLQLSRAGYPTCTVTDTIHLILPNAEFSVTPTEYCSDKSVTLSPDHPIPGASYEWKWQDKTNTSETIQPDFDEDEQGGPISLTITDPYGCSDQYTLNPGITVHEAEFSGEIQPENPVICEGGAVNLGYSPSPSETPPSGFQWYYNGTEINGATTTSHTADAPGDYTLKLWDENGCTYYGTDGVHVNVLPPPHLSIRSFVEICEGQAYTITGTLSPEDTEFRVYQDGDTPPSSWEDGPEVSHAVSNLSPGDYTYIIEYRDINHPDCVGSKTTTLRVYPIPQLTVDYEVLSCDPYKVRLMADANGASGYFTWSDGQEGETVEVDHGGAYRVRFQPDEGPCSVSQQIEVPKSPDQFGWIFPDGCFDYCRTKNAPYVIGPLYDFEDYHWDLDGNPESNGNGQVSDYTISSAGELTLNLDNGDCQFTTDTLNITYGIGCETSCKIDFKTVDINIAQETPFSVYHIIGLLHNAYGQTLSVELSSADGVFVQSPIAMSGNQTLNFNTGNPLIFIPNSGFTGGFSQVDIRATANINGKREVICHEVYGLNFPNLTGNQSAWVNMSVNPNPAEITAEVRYKVETLAGFDGGKMLLYSLSGALIETRTIKASKGEVLFDLSRLASGNYILVFYHHNARIGQQIIVKK